MRSGAVVYGAMSKESQLVIASLSSGGPLPILLPKSVVDEGINCVVTSLAQKIWAWLQRRRLSIH
jgi:hypothetical protein